MLLRDDGLLAYRVVDLEHKEIVELTMCVTCSTYPSYTDPTEQRYDIITFSGNSGEEEPFRTGSIIRGPFRK